MVGSTQKAELERESRHELDNKEFHYVFACISFSSNYFYIRFFTYNQDKKVSYCNKHVLYVKVFSCLNFHCDFFFEHGLLPVRPSAIHPTFLALCAWPAPSHCPTLIEHAISIARGTWNQTRSNWRMTDWAPSSVVPRIPIHKKTCVHQSDH